MEEFAPSIAALVSTSRRNNAAIGVASMLAFHAGEFVQVIEGAEPDVETIFNRIRRDGRHRDVIVLRREATARRSVADGMSLVGRSPRGRRALKRLATSSGGSLPAVDVTELLSTLQGVVAWEAGHDAHEAAADDQDDQDDPAGAREDTVRPGLDVVRLRSELATAGLSPASELARRPEDEAVDAVLAVACFSGAGLVARANANYCALLGFEPGTLEGLTHGALVASGDVDRLQQLWATLSEGRTVTSRHRGLKRNGDEVWLESAFRPRLDGDGRLVDVVEIATDQTARQLQRAEDHGQIQAIDTSQAVVHFDLDGTVLDANRMFLDAMGYSLEEVRGRHHGMFVDAKSASDASNLATLWTDLAAGRHRAGEYRRVGRDGRAVWLQATYNPIFDPNGRPFKIVQYATVVTEAKLRQADFQWQIAAIHKSHAVITFDLHGVILEANDIFLDAVGYSLDEIVGRHHRMFVEPAYAHGAEYAAFWRELARGRHQAGQYRRLGREAREVWLQATYNPVFDIDGRPFKVVKYATVVTEERLRQAEHQGQIAALHKAQCVVSFDLDGTILDANDRFLDAVGYRLTEVRGRHHRMFVEPGEAESAEYAAFWADLASGRFRAGEYKRVGREGREIWLQATYNPILDMNGRPFRVIKYATDVTAEKLERADFEGQIAAIRKSQGVVTLALDGTIVDINDAMLGVLGYARDELRGAHHSILVQPGNRDSSDYAAFWDTLRRGEFASGLYKRIGKDGREVWIQATYNPIFDLDGRPAKIIKIATDVTSQVALAEAYEDAKRQAQHDAATSLPNRMRLASFMSSALAESDARLVVLYIDLDRFKPINDTHGHAVGDRVLGELADRLRRALSKDQLVARVGGDEFVIAAPDLDEEAIEPFCQRLIALATRPIRHEGGDLRISLSIGVAVAPADGRAPDELLRCADAALYRSKQGGRSTYSFYSAAMNGRILSHRNAVDDIRRAIDAEEFFLEYQPRFDARSRRIQSLEALIRWQHPERGRISPAEFIPLAEKSGLIVQLGSWVLRTACRAARLWNGIGVSVNVSPVQFRSGDLLPIVRDALAEAGLRPEKLELEITEGVLLENAELAREALGSLKALGVRLSMDDFGTGYSSLSTLRNFPFDVIKIDRQFIADLDERRGGREVVQAILGLGKALGLSVTAEGVETEQQLKALAVDNCDEVQGYLLGRPIPAAGVPELLRTTSGQASQRDVRAPSMARTS